MKNSTLIRFFPRLSDIVFIAIFATVLLLGARMLNTDGDLPRHIATGKFILQTGSLPKSEPFVYPYQNRQFVSQQWLAGVIFYCIYQVAGLKGIVIFSAFLLAGTFSLLYSHLSIRHGLRISILILVLWGAATTSLSWITRPHLISMFFLSIWLIWTDKLRREEKISVWYFPLLMIFWANTHGEFISGILVLIACTIGAIIDYLFRHGSRMVITKTLLALLLSILVTVLNPGGIERWSGMFGFMNNQYMMSRMMETNPPNFQMPEMRILLGLITLSIFLLAFKKDRISAGSGFLLAGFSAMSLLAFRNIHLYGIVAPFVLSETLNFLKDIPIINRVEERLKNIETNFTRGFLLPIMATVGLITFTYTSNIGTKLYIFDPVFFPVKAVEWLKTNPLDGNMFNDLNWGGYISLNLWPNQLTFMDSVADITGELTNQYEQVITLQSGWENILEQHEIQWVIIPPNSLLANELTATGWKTLYMDETSIILQVPQNN